MMFPNDILKEVFEYLDDNDIIRYSVCSKFIYNLLKSHIFKDFHDLSNCLSSGHNRFKKISLDYDLIKSNLWSEFPFINELRFEVGLYGNIYDKLPNDLKNLTLELGYLFQSSISVPPFITNLTLTSCQEIEKIKVLNDSQSFISGDETSSCCSPELTTLTISGLFSKVHLSEMKSLSSIKCSGYLLIKHNLCKLEEIINKNLTVNIRLPKLERLACGFYTVINNELLPSLKVIVFIGMKTTNKQYVQKIENIKVYHPSFMVQHKPFNNDYVPYEGEFLYFWGNTPVFKK